MPPPLPFPPPLHPTKTTRTEARASAGAQRRRRFTTGENARAVTARNDKASKSILIPGHEPGCAGATIPALAALTVIVRVLPVPETEHVVPVRVAATEQHTLIEPENPLIFESVSCAVPELPRLSVSFGGDKTS